MKSEPFSRKIRTLTFDCRPAGGNPTQRRRPPDGKQSRKFFQLFLRAPFPFLIFHLRKKNFLLCPSADAECAAASHPQSAFGGHGGRGGVSPAPPFPPRPPEKTLFFQREGDGM